MSYYENNLLNMNGMAMSDWAIGIAKKILRQHGSVVIAGTPSSGEPLEFFTEDRLKAWGDKVKELPN